MPSSQPSAAMQDVLSSIRRLVSEDLRTEPRKGGDAAAGRDAAAPAGEKLVLTDALRVAEPLGTTARHDAPDDVAHHVATEVPPGRAAMTGRDEPGQATAGACLDFDLLRASVRELAPRPRPGCSTCQAPDRNFDPRAGVGPDT